MKESDWQSQDSNSGDLSANLYYFQENRKGFFYVFRLGSIKPIIYQIISKYHWEFVILYHSFEIASKSQKCQ